MTTDQSVLRGRKEGPLSPSTLLSDVPYRNNPLKEK